MQLSQLEYFVALAREKNFGRAAEQSFISPSAFSEAIKKLENELGVRLVDRGKQTSELTADGRLLLPFAEKILNLVDELREMAQPDAHESRVRVRLGVIPWAGALSTQLASRITRAYPRVRVEIAMGTTDWLLNALHHRELDAAIVLPEHDDYTGLRTAPLHEDRLVVIASPACFAGAGLESTACEAGRITEANPVGLTLPAITGKDLGRLPLCLLNTQMAARAKLDAALAERGLVVRPRIEADSLYTQFAMVEANNWAAVVPASAVRNHYRRYGLEVRSLIEPAVTLHPVLAWCDEEPLTRAVQVALSVFS
ncbi:LysR family transcriptional regulator [Actinobaculum suis]|uniref:LysR family transcriptional regulator n=1 Tax=Actinobaculum suis TaxID=1657 RepID=UPI0008087D20|nr:LysR family transcriptional regulator [Actinobaculum suis]OCA95104.1 hypothetical protein ACU20_04840 [Actinobaculum suis]OCA95570.1 hypothetical protein ACU21_03420 [Actinobaculum suis]